jgi:hypothetical protein
MRLLCSLILALYSLRAGAAVFKPEFPRLGGMKIGTPQDCGVGNIWITLHFEAELI